MRKFFTILTFILSTSVAVYLTWRLHTPLKWGEVYVPPMGKLLNPFSGFWQNAEALATKPFPNRIQPLLSSEASVAYDKRLVPHIFAANARDAAFLQGYVTAQHRLWQMDFSARAAAGRLAEVLGEKLVEHDLKKRRKGIPWAAEKAVNAWRKDPAAFQLVEAYAEGVNAYLDSLKTKDLPLEFKILDYKPERWSPLKTSLMLKSMAEVLCSREDDLEATNAYALFGKDTFDFLFPEYFPEQSPIIPSGTKWNVTNNQLDSNIVSNDNLLEMNYFAIREKPNKHNGSNNWAVSSSKTAIGSPILCGDPHLNLTLPSIWLEMQIKTPENNVYGVALPGVPGIIIGFNEHVAWTMTNVGHDVSDWYAIKWKDAQKKEYILDNLPKPVEFRYEEIRVRNRSTRLDTVRYTHWGPVAFTAKNNKRDMALRWVAHDTPDSCEVTVVSKLNKAKNYNDYIEALNGYTSPAQNFAFIAKDGDVALKVNGRLPLKRKGQGRLVQDGSKSSNAWQGFINMSELPLSKNPERGYVSSANQHSTAPDYPYPYHSEGFEEYRGRRLNQQLDSLKGISPKDMKLLQYDNYSLRAAEFLPLLLKQLETATLSTEEQLYVTQLKLWNYGYDRDKLEPVIFENWYKEFYNMIWDEMGTSGTVMKPTDFRTFALLRDAPENHFFDVRQTPAKETAKDIALQSFKKAFTDTNTWAKTQTKPSLSLYRQSLVGHLAKVPAFSRNIHAHGSETALNAMSKQHGPSWRMVVWFDENKQPQAQVVYPGGTSGNPGSPFYDNLLEAWQEGQYYEALFLQSPDNKRDSLLFVQSFRR